MGAAFIDNGYHAMVLSKIDYEKNEFIFKNTSLKEKERRVAFGMFIFFAYI